MIAAGIPLCRAQHPLFFAELMLIAVLMLAPTAVSALPDSFNKGGSGWDDETVATASQWGSRRGQEPGSRQLPASRSQLSLGSHRQALEDPVESAGGSGLSMNGRGAGGFANRLPLVRLPGRGMDLALDLYYDSKVWRKSGNVVIFDVGNDWPAPGFQLGFGKIVQFQLPSRSSFLAEPDGSIRLGREISSVDHAGTTVRRYQTTDDSFIDYRVEFLSSPNFGVFYAVAQYPNGTEIEYSAASENDPTAIFPTRIVDANGNEIRIRYNGFDPADRAPRIDMIVDTLGRSVQFHYDQVRRLTAVTVTPGYGGAERTLARLHYTEINLRLNGAFAAPLQPRVRGCVTPHPEPCPMQVLDAVVYPGSRTGYWFGDHYSSYGVPTRVSERRGMAIAAGSLDDQGTVSLGTETRARVYTDYPRLPSQLSDVPGYTQVVESWAGGPQPAAYQFRTDPVARAAAVVMPDGTRIVQTAYIKPGQFDDGMPSSREVFDSGGNRLQTTTTVWEQADLGGYLAPRRARIEHTNAKGDRSATQYGYGPLHNQIATVRELDYGGSTILSSVRTEYETAHQYHDRHIFNLPKLIQVFAGAEGVGPVVSRTEFVYDGHVRSGGPLQPTPGAAGRDDRFRPGSPAFVQATRWRGMVSQILRYPDPANLSDPLVQTEERLYDEAGNLTHVIGSACCERLQYVFEAETQYAWPSRIVRGAADTASPVRMQESFTYDFGTGLVTAHTNVDGRTTEMRHFPDSLRTSSVTFPATARSPGMPFIVFEYDDAALSAEARVEALPDSGPRVVASRSQTTFNGLGLPMERRMLAADGGWNVVATEYDALGRLRRQSLPFRQGLPAVFVTWDTLTYDALGRVRTTEAAASGTTTFFYDEPARPAGARGDPGATVRTVDSVGRERWTLRNALGFLIEVADPDPAGMGSVLSGVPLLTRYTYGAGYMQVNQESQEWRFLRDGLGRLTHQALPGRDPVLNGPDGRKYSDVFTYDRASNMTASRDARGRGADFVFDGDPLHRLRRIEHGPVLLQPGVSEPKTPDVTFEYVTTGDLSRVQKILTDGVIEEIYGYDGEGRPATLRRIFADRPNHPAEISYGYDIFSRVNTIVYPARYGLPNAPRRVVSYVYGQDSRPTRVDVDGQPLATNIAYGADGQIDSLTLGAGGPREINEFNDRHLNSLFRTNSFSRIGQRFESPVHDYSAAGQLITQTYPPGLRIRRYSYDALGRLGSMSEAAKGGGWEQTYAYDRHGNHTTVQATGTLAGGAPVPTDGIAQLAFDAGTGRISTTGFAYDAAGNMTRGQRLDQGWQALAYDQDGRLVQVTHLPCIPPRRCPALLPARSEIYRYGADRRRVVTEDVTIPSSSRPTLGPTQLNARSYYIWESGTVMTEFAEGPSAPQDPRWARDYLYLGGRLLATMEPAAAGGEVARYHHPGLIHMLLATNSADDQVAENEVLPFGTPLGGSSVLPVNRRFTTYDRSPVTGFDYAVNRFYDPATGRFTQPDPLGVEAASLINPQSLNTYAYVQNDPVNVTDPLGLDTPERGCAGNPNCTEVRGTSPPRSAGFTPGPRDLLGGIGGGPGSRGGGGGGSGSSERGANKEPTKDVPLYVSFSGCYKGAAGTVTFTNGGNIYLGAGVSVGVRGPSTGGAIRVGAVTPFKSSTLSGQFEQESSLLSQHGISVAGGSGGISVGGLYSPGGSYIGPEVGIGTPGLDVSYTYSIGLIETLSSALDFWVNKVIPTFEGPKLGCGY